MPVHQVKIVRLLLKQYGKYPNDVWEPSVLPIGEVEVEGETTALEVIRFAKQAFPSIPRHEFALVNWPEREEFNLEKLVPLDEPPEVEGEVV